jgi:hypothetical protein
MEYDADSRYSAGIGVQDLAGDVDDLSGESGRDEDGEDEKYLLRSTTD